MGAERRRRTVEMKERGPKPKRAPADPSGPPDGIAPVEPSVVPLPPPPRPVARRSAGRPHRHQLKVAAVIGATVVLLLAAGVAGVQAEGGLRSLLEGMFPAWTVTIDPAVAPAEALTTTTTAPPIELAALRGRPPSPVEGDEAVCAVPLRAGRLRPASSALWAGTSGPLTTGEVSDAEARAQIALVMRRRFRRDDPERAAADALQLYDSPRLRAATGEVVTLRAALAMLKGTLGEPALRFALTTTQDLRLRFGDLVMASASAETVNAGDQMLITVRRDFRNESPAVLAPVVFHELLHQNGQSQQPEEVVVSVLDARVALEMMRDLPAAFVRRSPLVDGLRGTALLQLNTRVGSVLAVDHSDVKEIAPDLPGGAGPSIGSWLRTKAGAIDGRAALYSQLADAPSKGHETLAAILREIAPDASVPDKVFFDQSAVDLVDTHAGVGLCDQLVAAEVAALLPRGTPAQKLARAYLNGLS